MDALEPGGAGFERARGRPKLRGGNFPRSAGGGLKEENRVTVSKSLAVEKQSVKLGTLITALFYDLTPDKQPVQIPTQSERRERELRERIKKAKRPVGGLRWWGSRRTSRTLP